MGGEPPGPNVSCELCLPPPPPPKREAAAREKRVGRLGVSQLGGGLDFTVPSFVARFDPAAARRGGRPFVLSPVGAGGRSSSSPSQLRGGRAWPRVKRGPPGVHLSAAACCVTAAFRWPGAALEQEESLQNIWWI
ncbi:unnamed protein product [Eretmochelys imbricata]